MNPSNVIVFGYGELGIAAAQALTDAGARITAVVVPSNRSGGDVDRIRAFAADRNIPVWVQPARRAIEPFLQQLKAAAPDVMVVWSYSMILPQAVLDVPRVGAVNVHGGLLPEYRGGHVMQWAIINGEAESGATLHYLDAGTDTGPVIADARFAIAAEDDAVRVREKLKTSGTTLLRQWWPRISAGTAPRVPQDETRARYWPLRMPEDGRIDWTMSTQTISRLIRALTCNEPGAFVEIDGRRITIREAGRAAVSDPRAHPGDIGVVEPGGVRVRAGDGDLLVSRVCVDGHTARGAAVAKILRPGGSR